MNLIPRLDPSPFCRTVWVSAKARDKWAGVIPAVSQFVHELEVFSVRERQRLATWQTIGEADLLTSAHKWAEMGLVSLPVRYSRQWQGFAHKFEEPIEGKPKNVSVIVARDIGVALRYREAFEKGDHGAQGEFLGFPKCCGKFFTETWAKGYIDPLWQAACQSEIVERDGNRLRIKGHPYSNAILRYCGVRIGFHIPCSFSCVETIRIANQRMALAEKMDAEKVRLLIALLSMPMSWDAYHSIAIVRTPIFYCITSSVPCAERYVVEVEGRFEPREVAKGMGFPFGQSEVSNGTN